MVAANPENETLVREDGDRGGLEFLRAVDLVECVLPTAELHEVVGVPVVRRRGRGVESDRTIEFVLRPWDIP